MKTLTKKGNINGLQTFIMGIVGVAIVLAIGFVVLSELASSTYSCPSALYSYNVSSGLCYETTNISNTTAELSGAGASLTTITDKLGNVPSWIGIIIVVVLASLVLGYFAMRQ